MAGFTKDVAPVRGGRLAPGLAHSMPLVKVSTGDFRWWVAPEHRDLLLGPTGLRLEEWLQKGQARIIKKGPHRIVYRVELPQLRFYVKRNLVADRITWFRQLVRPSKARMEFESAQEVAKRGLPTYAPLGMGEQKVLFGAGESVIITRSLDDTQEFHIFAVDRLAHLPADRQARLRQQLAAELGKLVARLHDAGVRHHDLHPANILVRLTGDEQLSLFLIDLSAVSLGTPLSWKQSRANLVILNRWFVLRANRSDRFRFWKAYREHRRLGKGCERLRSRETMHLPDDVEKHTQASNLQFWAHRDKRCLKNNRYYKRFKSSTVVGHAVTDLEPEILKALKDNPDLPFQWPGVKFLKDSPTSTVAELSVMVNGQPRTMIYKRFRITSWTDPLTALVRASPALRSWIHGQGFRERGLPTARPLAILHRKRHGLCLDGYLLTEKIDNAQDLHGFMASLRDLSGLRKRHVLRSQILQVATVLRELHRRSLSHRDLKAANILVSRDCSTFCSPFSHKAWTTPNQTLLPIFATSVWLIDLVGVRSHWWLSRARKVQNLARLNASFHQTGDLTRTDRLRFLRTYMRWGLHSKVDWKTWWKDIERATAEKVIRNLKRGRPLA